MRRVFLVRGAGAVCESIMARGARPWAGGRREGVRGNRDCDTRSHVVSELVKEVWLMPGT